MGWLHWYWRIFNFMARRVLAVGFVAYGSLFALLNAPAILPGGTIDVDGAPSNDLFFRLISVLLPLVLVVAGVALFRTKAYYPPGVARDRTPN